jgi:hypothetical protein
VNMVSMNPLCVSFEFSTIDVKIVGRVLGELEEMGEMSKRNPKISVTFENGSWQCIVVMDYRSMDEQERYVEFIMGMK